MINGVSRLHGEVSRRIFQRLYPRWPEREVPVGHITNGVHVPSWDSPWADEIWTAASGKERWRGSLGLLTGAIQRIERRGPVDFLRRGSVMTWCAMPADGLPARWAPRCQSPRLLPRRENFLDPNTLTLGFAPALCRIQAAQPAAYGSGPSGAPAQRQGAPGATDRGRQGTSLDENGKRSYRPGGVREPSRVVRVIAVFLEDYDIWCSRRNCAGCRCVDQHPRAVRGGLRYFRHEGTG